MSDSRADTGQARISAHWLRRRSQHEPDRPALSFGHRCWTYAELQMRVERCCAALQATGVSRGDRVAYLGPNHPMFLVVFFASTRIGAIFVPLNFRLTSSELQYIVNDAGVHTMIAAGTHCDIIAGIQTQLCCKRYLRIGDAISGWESLADLLSSSSVATLADFPDPDDTAAIMYTSGTTGLPKGAMLTHDNLWTASINLLVTVGFNASDVSLNSAPLFHVGGLCIVVLPVLLAGGHVILHEAFEPLAFITAIGDSKITVAFAVPAMMTAMAQIAGFARIDLSSLRLLIAGGASVPESLLRDYAARGIPVSQGWGMTESAATGTFLAPRQAHLKLGSCGKPAMMSECKVVDFSRREITAPDVKGELCIRGANVMKGYWNRPDATAEALDADGWYYSGDIGYVDRDGYYYVCDRLKDMVITGGENVYPAEVEGVLRAHPSILDIAVIGAPDRQWGERVVAVVVLRPQVELTLDDIKEFARDRLARYKHPRELRIVNELPRNPGGKVLKGVLRAARNDDLPVDSGDRVSGVRS